jgi:hypothetical protein
MSRLVGDWKQLAKQLMRLLLNERFEKSRTLKVKAVI